jgi:hypothetical protein
LSYLNTVNPPEDLNEETRLVGLEFKFPDGCPEVNKQHMLANRSIGNMLAHSVVGEFRNSQPYWIWPEDFSYESPYQSVADICDMIEAGYERQEKMQREKNEQMQRKADLTVKLKDVELVDLDCLCYAGPPAWEQVQKFWLEGEWCEEKYLVKAIELHLLTEEQRKRMFDLHLSIEKMLNGRYGGEDESAAVRSIYGEWNKKLGYHAFGY